MSGDFSEASTIFEEKATACLSRDLEKYKFDEYMSKAIICKVVDGDLVAARKLLIAFDRSSRNVEFSMKLSVHNYIAIYMKII